MKTFLVNSLAASVIAITAATAVADDELVVYVFKDGGAASGITVKLDGDEEELLSKAGAATFDLSGGGHSVQLLQDGESIHSFRFDSAAGQLTDINVLIDGEDTKVAIESFFKSETAVEKSKAPKGTLRGYVSGGGYSVSGAEVTIEDTGETVSTGDDGSYEFELPRGLYSVSVYHPDFDEADLEDIRVVSNVTKGVNVTLQSAQKKPSSSGMVIQIGQPLIEEVTVMGSYNASAFDTSERFSTNIVDTLDIEAIARFGDSDVAASVTRLPSVTVQEDSFVFIRGLGGRYVTTTLNGATMPSTNPSKRSVPLDLFPSNIVSQLDVKKSFEASMPGDSTGGNLVINTRTFPDEFGGKFSFKLGYNGAITGDEVSSDPLAGDYDWAGWDDDSRRESAVVEAIAIVLNPALALGIDDDGAIENNFELSSVVETELRREAALLLTDGLDLDTATATPKVSIGAQLGNLFYVGDGELGFFAAANYKSGWAIRANGEQNTYSDLGTRDDEFVFEEYKYNVDVSGLFSVGYAIGNHTLESNTIISRVSESSVRESEGFDSDSGENSYKYTIKWEERQFLSQQFTGEHLFGANEDLTANWQVTGSQATRYAPDRRDVKFSEQEAGVFALALSELIRRYDELTDNNFDVSTDLEWLLPSSAAFESTLDVGAQYIFRDRESDSSTYGFAYGNLVGNPDFDVASNRLVSDVIFQDNVTGDQNTGLAFQDKTLKSDSYDADMNLSSVYFSYDMLIASDIQVVLGARYEEYEQTTQTFNISTGNAVETVLESEDLLPSLSINWTYSEEQQIRFAYSETTSRPDFKETSNAVFYDDEYNARIVGNPGLTVADITNYDLRWEKYWSDTDTFSFAVFYKEFVNPIERVVQAASGTAGNSRTFQNAPEAELYGAEIDGRYEFALNDSFSQSIFVTSNASWIESEVTLENGNTRALQGQPEYTFNVALGWDDIDREQELTVAFNQNGQAIVDSGVNGAADVLSEPVASLNINYKKSFGEDLSFGLKLSNIMDSDIEFTQGGETFLKYNRGAEFEAGIDWKF